LPGGTIVGKDYHTEEHVVGYYTAGNRMLYWGKLSAFGMMAAQFATIIWVKPDATSRTRTL
jgi:hypothetical protein